MRDKVGETELARHLAAGRALVTEGRYFDAHEELELAWRAAAAEERDFLQALVHIAVAWYQAGRGRRIGCERQLEKAARRLAPFAPSHRGVDVAALLEQVAAGQAAVAAGSLDLAGIRPLGQTDAGTC